MDFTVELTQVGSTGRVLFETNNGYAFTAALVYNELKMRKDGRRVPSRGPRKERHIMILSPCCQSAHIRLRTIGTPIICSKCRNTVQWEHGALEFSLSSDFSDAQKQFEATFEAIVDDPFELVILSGVLVNAVEETFKRIASGERISGLLRDANSYAL